MHKKRFSVSLIGGLVLSLAAGVANASPIVSGFNSNTLAANDDSSTGAVALGFNFNFFGNAYNQLYVNNNGNVTFNSALSTYTPFGLTTSTSTPIIAPFFADVDTRGTGSGLVTYGTGLYDGHNAFGANWIGVGYYNQHTDLTDSFQMILVDRSDIAAGDADIYFNYGSIQWETGDASSGTGGLGGSSAHVGYSNGSGAAGTFAELAGSGVNGAFIDGGPNSLQIASNDGVAGQVVFQVRGGAVTAPPPSPVPAPASVELLGLGLLAMAGVRLRKKTNS